jgi:hypothetical protein
MFHPDKPQRIGSAASNAIDRAAILGTNADRRKRSLAAAPSK